MTATSVAGEQCTVFVPCDVVSVRARMGYSDTLTPVERIVLHAIYAGSKTLPDLCADLGLSRRLAVDLVHDLWRAKYVRLVRSYAGIEVSADVARLIDANRLHTLKSAETVVESRPVMIEKLSGYVLPVPVRGQSRARDRALTVPVENSPVRVEEASMADVIDAVERGLRSERRDLPDGPARELKKVLSAYVEQTQQGPPARRWLPLDVRPVLVPDADSGQDLLLVTVVDEALPSSFREEAGRTLTRIVSARPDDDFSRALRSRARIGLVEAADLSLEVARLRQLAERAADTVAGRRLAVHGELESLLRRVRERMQEHLDQEVEATLIVADAHRHALDRLIAGTISQLVLTGPWMNEMALGEITPGLSQAITKRAVQVCVFWGIQHGDRKDRRAAHLLYELTLATGARPYGSLREEDDAEETEVGRLSKAQVAPPPARAGSPKSAAPWFLVPQESSRTHAKVAVADAGAALVTSWNFLSRVDPSREVGVVVRAPAGAATSAPRDLLRWARSLPSYEMSRQMLVEDAAFALARSRRGLPSRDNAQNSIASSLLPELRTPDQPPGEALDDDTVRAVRQWAASWMAIAVTAQRWVLERTLPTATVLVDGEHREALWAALRQARSRLVITSHRLSSEVVGDRFVQALETALERGVQIRIEYGETPTGDEFHSGDADGGITAAEHRLAELVQRHRDRMAVRRSGTHSKVLLYDDVAVIGSFNFLSYEGTYSTRNLYRQRSEVSLRIRGPEFADEVARWAGLPTSARSKPPQLGVPVVDPLIGEVQRLLNELPDSHDPAEVVERHLSSSGHPWQLLDRLEHASRSALRIAAALCLSRWPEQAPPERRDHWRRWLISDLWYAGAYLEAAVLRAALEDDAFRPRTTIAVLAAARSTPHYATAFFEAYAEQPSLSDWEGPLSLDLSDVTAGEHSAILATAIDLVLFQADPIAAEVLAEYQVLLARPEKTTDMKTVIPAWKELVEAALSYSVQGLGQPMPQEQIRALTSQADVPLAVDRLWEAIRTEIRRAAETQLPNAHSQRTLHELMRGGVGEIGVLRDIAEREDRTELAAWVAQAPTAESGFGRWIDQAGRRVDPSRAAMHSTHRRKVIRDLMKIARDARRLDRLPAPFAVTSPSAEEVELLEAARRCAAVCAEVLPAMVRDADPPDVGVPETQLVHEVLRSLELLETWHLAEHPGTEDPANSSLDVEAR